MGRDVLHRHVRIGHVQRDVHGQHAGGGIRDRHALGLDVDLVGFNSLLGNNNLTPLKLTPTALAVPASCTFVWPAATTGKGK